MIAKSDFRKLFETFSANDWELQVGLTGLSASVVADRVHWRRQFEIGWLDFQSLLWKIVGEERVENFIGKCGTMQIGISLMSALEKLGYVILEGNSIRWTRRLFPRTSIISEAVQAWLPPDSTNPGYGQLRVDRESNETRVSELLSVLPPFGRKVLFLGDDDLTSVYLANRKPGEVHVLDIDEQLLCTVSRVSDRFNLGIITHQHNVAYSLPTSLRANFDIVHCDPPDGGYWLERWLTASVEALYEVSGARLFISFSPARLGHRTHAVHSYLGASGFILERAVNNCNCYNLRTSADPFYSSDWAAKYGIPQKYRQKIWTDLHIFKKVTVGAPVLAFQEYREFRRPI